MKPSFTAYLKSWSDEFLAKSNQVRDLIGDAHWLSDGHHKESLIRCFLQAHLPPNLSVKRGFVRPPSIESHSSPEVDVLVANIARHPPLFSEGDLHILAPSGVVGHIEVKTTLSGNTLNKAVLNVSKVQTSISTCADAMSVARGILFANHGAIGSVTKLLDIVEGSIDALQSDHSAVIDKLPNWIATFDKYSVFLVPDQSSGGILAKAFDSGSLSAALAYADFFATIRLNRASDFATEMDEIVEAIDLPAPEQRKI